MIQSKSDRSIGLLATRENADVYLYSAQIQSPQVDRFRTLVCERKPKHDNVILFLTTYGGDPDAAYRLSTCLRRNYKKVSVYVFGLCKSAGTLAALGADNIVLGDFGELGPLDVQLTKPDELVPTSSGLDIFQAMGVVTNSAFEAFEKYLIDIINKSEGHISAKTAAEIARELAVGLFAPMTAQIEPERLGEVQRAINIAIAYGQRLNRGNLKKEALDQLVQGYPTHTFVIDLTDAKTLFNEVREANSLEREVAARLPGLRRQAPEPIVLDLVQVGSAMGVAQHVTRSKTKRSIRSSSPPSSGRQGNIAQLRPDVKGNVAAAQKNAHTGSTTTDKDVKPKGNPTKPVFG